MSINFNSDDVLVVKQSYVSLTLAGLNTDLTRRYVPVLGTFASDPATVLDSGNFTDSSGTTISWIRLVPLNTANVNYNSGNGRIIYFANDSLLNNSFEYATAFISDLIRREVLNNTGSTLSAFSVVRLTGFDSTTQLPTVGLADASDSSTAFVFGMVEADIANGAQGSCIIEGTLSGVDTSGFSLNELVYLSDTPGQFNSTSTPGTETVALGRVNAVSANEGSIIIKGSSIGGGDSGGGSGSTGAQGATGIQGITGPGTDGMTGLIGPTGLQGVTGNSFAGSTGAQGATGAGSTGVRGLTGIGEFQDFMGATVYLSADQSISSGSASDLNFNSSYLDTDSILSSGSLEIPTGGDGYWSFMYTFSWDDYPGSNWYVQLTVTRASADNVVVITRNTEAGDTTNQRLTGTGTIPAIYVEEGDTATITVEQNTGGAINIETEFTIFGGWRVAIV